MQKGTTKDAKVTKKAVATDETQMKHGYKGRNACWENKLLQMCITERQRRNQNEKKCSRRGAEENRG
jgi:hypothetical protein